MSAERHREWLRSELPKLREHGVLDADNAERLAAHYELAELRDPRATRKLVIALLGSVLIGAGAILLVAHNWQELSRPARVALSLGQLALAQLVTFYVIARKSESTAAREASGAFLSLSVGVAIALISQTYHVGGKLGDFLFAWVVLALPVVYVVPSKLSASLCALGLPAVAFAREHAFDHGLLYVVIAIALVPALKLRTKADRIDGLTRLARFLFVLGVAIAGAELFGERALWLLYYAGLAAAATALGARLEQDTSRSTHKPFSLAGALGTLGLLLALSYDELWRELSSEGLRGEGSALVLGSAIVLAMLWASVGLLSIPVLRRRALVPSILLGTLLLLVLLQLAAALGARPGWLALLVSAMMLAFGAGLLTLGLRTGSSSLANRGLGVLSLLFAARFFDTDLSFVARGLGFVLLGCAFLGVNAWLARKREHDPPAPKSGDDPPARERGDDPPAPSTGAPVP